MMTKAKQKIQAIFFILSYSYKIVIRSKCSSVSKLNGMRASFIFSYSISNVIPNISTKNMPVTLHRIDLYIV